MKLGDALRRVNEGRAAAADPEWTVAIACGFTPVHFETFLHAALLDRSDRPFSVQTGLYGDLVGNVRGLAGPEPAHAVVPIEWSDLDPRLGLRTTHGWRRDRLEDVLATVELRGAQLCEGLEALAAGSRAVVSLPTLPLPPLFHEPSSVASPLGLSLRARVHELGARLAANPAVSVLDPQWLDSISPFADRADPRGELRNGFPYRLPHAAALAAAHAERLVPSPPKKGLITDLDDTLWRGLVGEDGVDGIGWDLDHGAQIHGLYQEVLHSLLAQGVLVGVASKNDPAVVQRAFARDDLVLDASQLFPLEVGWHAKSQSVASILEAWNVDARDVVFVDDSAIERAEVGAAFPTLECLAFPTQDEAGALELLRTLRLRLGRTTWHEEDALRVASLRSEREQQGARATDPEAFLAGAEAELELAFDQPDARSLELLNKTNQFNLNGRRWDDARWALASEDPERFVLGVSYRDKFGPLGKIAVVCGSRGSEPLVDAWVLSCRAFSRRIEHQVLSQLFEQLGAAHITFDFASTERNGPLRDFLSPWFDDPVTGPLKLSRDRFEAECPQLYGEVRLT